ncbi:membrane protein [Spirochaetia bacterium]|nr:membrane protein [Spirochaetia bacterium]
MLLLLLAVTAFAVPRIGADEFFYKHETGDMYRILSTVHESVYINRRLSLQTEILNRIAVTVGEIRDGRARHTAVFQTAERAAAAAVPGAFVEDQKSATGGLVAPVQNAPAQRSSPQEPWFQWSREYESVFDRDSQGAVTIDKQYFMPVVRNVPVFPKGDIGVGEGWSAEGHEMHDFRDSFGISEPYRIPFTADYTFLGSREWRGKSYPAISVSYRIFAEPEKVSGRVTPVRIRGASDQIIYWDSAMGQPAAYEEDFRMIFELSDGRTVEYQGRAEAEIVESSRMDKTTLAEEIAEEIRRLNIQDATVRIVDEGIAISLEDIQFQSDSAILLPSEQGKLDKLEEILRRYSGRDIMVGGHTALAGTEAARKALSLERAGAVADYLIGKGIRTPDRVVVRGYGADRPLGDNTTEAGRARNRRVEITILEN